MPCPVTRALLLPWVLILGGDATSVTSREPVNLLEGKSRIELAGPE